MLLLDGGVLPGCSLTPLHRTRTGFGAELLRAGEQVGVPALPKFAPGYNERFCVLLTLSTAALVAAFAGAVAAVVSGRGTQADGVEGNDAEKSACLLRGGWLCVALLSLVAGAAVAATALGGTGVLVGSSIRYGIETYDKDVIGAEVIIGSLYLDPFVGYLELKDVEVLNPKGYATPYLLRAKRIKVDLEMQPLVLSRGSHMLVAAIVVDDVDVIYERKSQTSNVGDILDYVREHAMPEQSGNGGVTRVTLRRVSIEGLRVKLALSALGGAGAWANVPAIHYDNFADEEDVHTPEAVAQALVRRILTTVLSFRTL